MAAIPPPIDTEADGSWWQQENRRFAQLISQAQGGSVEAFEQLYERSARWLLSHVRRLVRDGQAEDVLAEVYLQVWRSLASYDPARGPPAVWLSMIARSRALDHLRREQRHVALGEAESAGALFTDVADGPEQLLWRAQQCRLVHLSLNGAPLSNEERMVVGLAYFRDKTQQEIAVLTGLPLGTVKSLMSRAQKKLSVQLAAPPVERGAGINASP